MGIGGECILSPREQCLNFNMNLIEQLFGIKFKGTAIEEKEQFSALHDEARRAAVDKLLAEVYDEFMNQ